jgi:hypothetical protein
MAHPNNKRPMMNPVARISAPRIMPVVIGRFVMTALCREEKEKASHFSL